MKKRFFKALCILMLVVLTVGILAGCSAEVYSINNDRYREQVIITVGKVEVKMGELADWFSRNASQYTSQYEMQEIWDALYPTFIQQKMLLNEFLSSDTKKNTSVLADKYRLEELKYVDYMYYSNKNDTSTEWLKTATVASGFPANAVAEDKTIVLMLKSVYSSLLSSLDSSVETVLTGKGFVFNEAETKEERTDMIKKTVKTLWEENYNIDDYLKSLDKQLKNYPKQDFGKLDFNYIFSPNDEILIGEGGTLEKLNDRLNKDEDEDMEDITAQDYIDAQREAMRTTLRNLKLNGSKSINEYLKKALEEQIESQMINMAQAPFYKNAEESIDKAEFNERLEDSAARFVQEHTMSKASFETFIRSLGESSFVYNVPAEYQGQYHYIVNLLLPFSDDQTAELESVKSFSSKTRYEQYRQELAKQIEVKEFSEDEPDGTREDGKGWDNPDRFVTIDASGIKINASWASGIKNVDDFKNEVYLYNTDPGALNATYGYVIGLHEFDIADKSNEIFVPEFADAARKLAQDVVDGKPGRMTVCVTDFGIHIIYYAGEVTADFSFDSAKSDWVTPEGKSVWDSRYNYGIEGGSASYRFFLAYYDEIKEELVTKLREDLLEVYKKGEGDKKISVNESLMKKFLSDSKIKFVNDYSKM